MNAILELFEKQSWMALARKESKKSIYKFQLGCVVIKGSSVISTGYNELRYKRIGDKWSEWTGSLHCEVSALTKKHKSCYKGATLFIYREDKTARYPMNSKPCEYCESLARFCGIKKIIYSYHEYPYYKEIKLNETDN